MRVQAAVQAYQQTLARGPVATYEDIWWHAWPDAFIGLVRGAAARGIPQAPSTQGGPTAPPIEALEGSEDRRP